MGTVRKKSENTSIDTFSTYSNNLLNLENRMARVNLDTSPAYLNGQSAALTFDPIEITDSTQYSSFLNFSKNSSFVNFLVFITIHFF